jgi:poly [ADP-ribose] polymerase
LRRNGLRGQAVGRSEPDPSCDVTFEIDGEEVVVAQGKPVARPEGSGSTFSQSEYLLYREEQVRTT